MPMSATKLRADIYRVLDEILETGIPVDIERGGRLLRITPVKAPSKLDRLEPHPDFVAGGTLDDLVHIDWSGEWKP